jgi:hypothetical protein
MVSPAAQRRVTHRDPDGVIAGIVAARHAGAIETMIEAERGGSVPFLGRVPATVTLSVGHPTVLSSGSHSPDQGV